MYGRRSRHSPRLSIDLDVVRANRSRPSGSPLRPPLSPARQCPLKGPSPRHSVGTPRHSAIFSFGNGDSAQVIIGGVIYDGDCSETFKSFSRRHEFAVSEVIASNGSKIALTTRIANLPKVASHIQIDGEMYTVVNRDGEESKTRTHHRSRHVRSRSSVASLKSVLSCSSPCSSPRLGSPRIGSPRHNTYYNNHGTKSSSITNCQRPKRKITRVNSFEDRDQIHDDNDNNNDNNNNNSDNNNENVDQIPQRVSRRGSKRTLECGNDVHRVRVTKQRSSAFDLPDIITSTVEETGRDNNIDDPIISKGEHENNKDIEKNKDIVDANNKDEVELPPIVQEGENDIHECADSLSSSLIIAASPPPRPPRSLSSVIPTTAEKRSPHRSTIDIDDVITVCDSPQVFYSDGAVVDMMEKKKDSIDHGCGVVRPPPRPKSYMRRDTVDAVVESFHRGNKQCVTTTTMSIPCRRRSSLPPKLPSENAKGRRNSDSSETHSERIGFVRSPSLFDFVSDPTLNARESCASDQLVATMSSASTDSQTSQISAASSASASSSSPSSSSLSSASAVLVESQFAMSPCRLSMSSAMSSSTASSVTSSPSHAAIAAMHDRHQQHQQQQQQQQQQHDAINGSNAHDSSNASAMVAKRGRGATATNPLSFRRAVILPMKWDTEDEIRFVLEARRSSSSEMGAPSGEDVVICPVEGGANHRNKNFNKNGIPHHHHHHIADSLATRSSILFPVTTRPGTPERVAAKVEEAALKRSLSPLSVMQSNNAAGVAIESRRFAEIAETGDFVFVWISPIKEHTPPSCRDVFKERHVKIIGSTMIISKVTSRGVGRDWFVLGGTKAKVDLRDYFRCDLREIHGIPTIALYPRDHAEKLPTLYLREDSPANVIIWRRAIISGISGIQCFQYQDMNNHNQQEQQQQQQQKQQQMDMNRPAPERALHARHLKWWLKTSASSIAQHLTIMTQQMYRRHASDWIRLHESNKRSNFALVRCLSMLSTRLSALVSTLSETFPREAPAVLIKSVAIARHLHESQSFMAMRQMVFAIDDNFNFGLGFGGQVHHDAIWEKIDKRTSESFMKLIWTCLDVEILGTGLDEAPTSSSYVVPIECVGRALDQIDAQFPGVEPDTHDARVYSKRIQDRVETIGLGLSFGPCRSGKGCGHDCAILDDLLSRVPDPTLAQSRKRALHRSVTFKAAGDSPCRILSVHPPAM